MVRTWMLTMTVSSLVVVLSPLAAHAQFDPSVESSFDPVVAGEESKLTQELLLLEGDEPLNAFNVSLDQGLLETDALEVDDVVGSMTAVYDIELAFPGDLGIVLTNEIVCDIVVASVDDAAGTFTAEAIVVIVDDIIEEYFDFEDQVAYTLAFTDFADGGVLVELEDQDLLPPGDGALPVPAGGGEPVEFPSDIELNWCLDGVYVHGDGEAVAVSTSLISADGSEVIVEESIDLVGGTDGPHFKRGDADGSGTVAAIPDGLFLLKWGFQGAAEPPCLDAADVDDSGSVAAIPDALALLRWQFAGDAAPADPGPEECGPDPDAGEDAADCANPPDVCS